ncbi:uncharacterized protein E0L32_000200 [Thyridium curvatum]|uniref:Caib baif family enzyme n=1 Tax=Thyridium curvatum TaxID=1093900 RepID=A0A507B9L9_9PEZI|nr:uncharacterized protein E0L32_000200 [Thyridium curvatum]TPX15866.1 hypothetical protein E0L32_000200 [Thyridium curvatum]
MGSMQDDNLESSPLCRIVTPVGMLGYGFEDEELNLGLELALHSGDNAPVAIILDSGSTDSGPAKLALGSMTCPRSSYARDLTKLLEAVLKYRVPLLISSAGGDGTDAHVKEFLDIIGEIAESLGPAAPCLKVLAIYSDIPQETVLSRHEAGHISGCGPCVPTLTREAVLATPTVVAQAGPEPLLSAMAAHPDFDILIAGRAYDPAPYVAFAAHHALRQQQQQQQLSATAPLTTSLSADLLGGIIHMGKVMECGGLCAVPKSKAALATVYASGAFDVRPLAPKSRCTPSSVAAHTLYEKSRPDVLAGPGGAIDVTTAEYTALPDGTSVRVHDTRFVPSEPAYTVKLEGARVRGYRTVFMGSFGDPILIKQLPKLLSDIKAYVALQHRHVTNEKWEIGFHTYGGEASGEVFLVGEALADSQVLATSVASTARVGCTHGPYEGQKANAGNFGMGIGGKLEIEMGPCAEFSVYHLMDLESGEEYAVDIGDAVGRGLFKWEKKSFGVGAPTQADHPTRTIGAKSVGLTGAEIKTIVTDVRSVIGKAAETTSTTTSRLRGKRPLGDAARIIRSKNSGPFEITLDALFDSKTVYEQVKSSGALKSEVIAQLYELKVEDIVWSGFFDQALAYKVTIPRRRDGKPSSSGSFMENDVQGSQQYKPLMNIEIDFGT